MIAFQSTIDFVAIVAGVLVPLPSIYCETSRRQAMIVHRLAEAHIGCACMRTELDNDLRYAALDQP